MSGTVAIQGTAFAVPVASETVDLIVTSPPYFEMRSYEDNDAVYDGQVGAEPSIEEYVSALVQATKEASRVLKPTGSLWVNLGDRYKSRSLTGVPWRYVLRCVDELGLTLRAELVWEKTNAYIDAKASDRVRRTHETWFHLSPSRRPYHNPGAVSLPPEADYTERPQYRRAEELFAQHGLTEAHRVAVRSVGNIDTRGGQVRSGGSWSSDAGRLAAEVREALGSYYRELCGTPNRPKMPGSVRTIPAYALKVPNGYGLPSHFASFPIEWPLWIIQGWCPPEGVVLDPFGGAGTTALAASVLGRSGISLDLSRDYTRLADWRVSDKRERARAHRIAAEL